MDDARLDAHCVDIKDEFFSKSYYFSPISYSKLITEYIAQRSH
jgi:hypothetical protein